MKLMIIFALVLTVGCASAPPARTPGQHDNLMSVLWIQTASEYAGNLRTLYAGAGDQLADLLERDGVTADLAQAAEYDCSIGVQCVALADQNLIPAVVLDVDDTALDNSSYQASLIANNMSFDPASWDEWLMARSATAVPGAVEFVLQAQAAGVAVIYLTNRRCQPRDGSEDSCPQKTDTIANLAAAGFPEPRINDQIILRGERPDWDMSEKGTRRAWVAERYRILMLIGDDMGDLASDVKRGSPKERTAFVEQHAEQFGEVWFQLPNPAYGSWVRALGAENRQYLKLP